MRKCAVSFLLASLLLSGCWGIRDIDHIVYVHAIGVDYKDNKFIVYVQFINFTGLAKTNAGGGQQQVSTAVGKATGETFNIVTDTLYPSVQQMVSWGHVKGIVFTERALKHAPLQDVFDVLDRYSEIRHTLWTYATKEPLDDLFSTVPLLQGAVYYSLLANPEDIYRQSSFIRPIRLNRFLADANEPGSTVRLPYLSISKVHWQEDNKQKNMLSVSGLCFVHDYRLEECVNRSKLKGIRWVEQDIARTPIYVQKEKRTIASIVVLGPKSKISYKMEKGEPRFTIEVQAKGSVIELRERMPEKELLQLAKKTIEKEIRSLYQLGQQQGIDMLNLSEAMYRQNPKDWKKVAVHGEIPLTDETLKAVKVKLSLDTSGTRKFR